MKSFLFPALCFISVLLSCNNKKAGQKSTLPADTSLTEISTNTKSEELEVLKQDLLNKPPQSEDGMKNLLPSTLMGAHPENINVSPASGPIEASADYRVNDSTTIHISIIDCAGPAGTGYFSLQYMDAVAENSADDETTMKQVTFNGRKAFESCQKDATSSCTFTFLTGDRYLVYAESRTAGIDLLKQAAGSLHIK
jgi:hypothetical protein